MGTTGFETLVPGSSGYRHGVRHIAIGQSCRQPRSVIVGDSELFQLSRIGGCRERARLVGQLHPPEQPAISAFEAREYILRDVLRGWFRATLSRVMPC